MHFNKKIKVMIAEDYVSFETAKLLKEKGFSDASCFYSYMKNGGTKVIHWENELNLYPKPTLQMAMKWLREIYDIFIVIHRGLTGTGWVYSHEIYKDSQCLYARYGASYDTYEEAIEAALKYCLENLI